MPRPDPTEPRFDIRKFDQPGEPKVSVIIPSTDGHRGGNVELLLDGLQEQTHRPFEVILPIGFRPSGRARNRGAERALGEYLIFIDDDVELQDEEMIANFVQIFVDSTGEIDAVEPSQNLLTYSNDFQRRCGKQLEWTSTQTPPETPENDRVTHACLAIPRDLYWEIGGESEILPYQSHSDFRSRLRKSGHTLLHAPNTTIGHPAPENWEVLFNTAFKNGEGAAEFSRYYSKYPLPASVDSLDPMREVEDSIDRAKSWMHHTWDSIRNRQWIRLVYETGRLAGWFSGKVLDFDRNRILMARAAKIPIGGFNQIRRLKNPPTPALRILTYHRVDCFPDYPLCIPKREFRRQIEYLLDQNILLDFEEAMRVIRGEREIRRNQVALTFDDGYRDHFTNAYRILEEYGIKACFFLVTDRIGSLGEFDWLKKLGPPNYHILNWEQAECLAESGMALGSHTARHERLALLQEDQSRATIEESLQTLDDRAGVRTKYFAYPYGRKEDYSNRDISILEENGIEFGFTSTYGAIRREVDPYRLPRIDVDPSDTFEIFKSKIYGDFDFLGEWRP